jgi:hypothetical protein
MTLTPVLRGSAVKSAVAGIGGECLALQLSLPARENQPAVPRRRLMMRKK